MKVRQRAHGTNHLAYIFLAWGCAVYQPDLLSNQAGSSSAGTGARSGDAGSGGNHDVAAGSPSAGNQGGGVGGSGPSAAGASASEAGASTAGAETAGEGGALACVPETPAEFCTRLGKNCGPVDGNDNCGSPVTGASCGACSGFEKCGGGDEQSVCGALTAPAVGGSTTASSVMFLGENGSQAFDLDATTKWYAGDGNNTGWLAYQFPGNDAHVVKSYSVTSGNDFPQRDPRDWELQGSNNGSSWTNIDERSAQTFAARRQTNLYTCTNTTPYRWYRLLVTANNGSTALQLSELVLYGI